MSVFGKTRKLIIKYNEKKIDNIKQAQALIPNVIHSLDAAHLINLINSADDDNFKPLITIHDCFGTLPNKMSDLEYRVKKQFILIYLDQKFITDFHNRFIQALKYNHFEITEEEGEFYVYNKEVLTERIKLPSIPVMGELDIEKIIKSRYLIT